MEIFIALLRGINVGGQNVIKMPDLKARLGELGMSNVQTYIQSGNLVFTSQQKATGDLENEIKQKILDEFNSDVSVFVKTSEQLKRIFHSNPYLPARNSQTNQLLVTLLANDPPEGGVNMLLEYATFGEEIIGIGKELYLYFPNGYGRSKLSNNFIEKKLNTLATTRNWNTITKLVDMANKIKSS